MECVGFVECPCVDCRKRRRDANEAHNRGQNHDGAYCEPCRRKRREEAQEGY